MMRGFPTAENRTPTCSILKSPVALNVQSTPAHAFHLQHRRSNTERSRNRWSWDPRALVTSRLTAPPKSARLRKLLHPNGAEVRRRRADKEKRQPFIRRVPRRGFPGLRGAGVAQSYARREMSPEGVGGQRCASWQYGASVQEDLVVAHQASTSRDGSPSRRKQPWRA